jgi:RsiW-degrading membrane proteinase PrsW (M82 family)
MRTAELEQMLEALPDNRIEGAHLPRRSMRHWGYALVSALVYFALLAALFPRENDEPHRWLGIGLFTGTIGIIFLVIVQVVAALTRGVWMTGGSIFVVLFYIAKFIAFSYDAAEDPSNGFLLSFLGFTCGVGLCEELCKALPLLRRARRGPKLSWREACLYGLASGIGFGVSEGIIYAGGTYNGLSGGPIYAVRFASCVALHAVWSASVGLMLYSYRKDFKRADEIPQLALNLLRILAIPMVLHGLYDTLLKKDAPGLALFCALVSFAWLAFQIEQRRESEAVRGTPVAWQTGS